MNTNMSLTCEVCEQDTDCRIGYSNRKIQPLSFACPHCGSLMQITLDISNAPTSKFDFKSCHPSIKQSHGPFDGRNPFVDLHLDFPVRFGKYVMGFTPFMMAMQDLNDPSDSDPNAIQSTGLSRLMF
jgi:transcription elongation factor Elf1